MACLLLKSAARARRLHPTGVDSTRSHACPHPPAISTPPPSGASSRCASGGRRKQGRRETLAMVAFSGGVRGWPRSRSPWSPSPRASCHPRSRWRSSPRWRWPPASSSASGPPPPSRPSSSSCRCCCSCPRRTCRCSWRRRSRSARPGGCCGRAPRPDRALQRRRRRLVLDRPRASSSSPSAPQEPGWEHFPVYALALRRPARWSTTSSTSRASAIALRVPPREAAADLGLAERVDLLLTPLGLLAALAAVDAPAGALLVVALFPLLRRLRARARGRGSSAASSWAAPTAAPRCCCATCSRRTTSTPVTTPRTSSRSSVAGRRADGRRRGRAARDRDGRAPARHRQDRRARRDHQQARARWTTTSGRS